MTDLLIEVLSVVFTTIIVTVVALAVIRYCGYDISISLHQVKP